MAKPDRPPFSSLNGARLAPLCSDGRQIARSRWLSCRNVSPLRMLARITARLQVSIGDENALSRSRLDINTLGKDSAMKGRRFKQTKSLEERLADEAKLLREQARLLPCGALREEVMRRAWQAETGLCTSAWFRAWAERAELAARRSG